MKRRENYEYKHNKFTIYFKRPGDSDEEYYENLKELNPELIDMLEFTSIAKIGIELKYDVTYRFEKRTLRLEKDEPVDMEIMKAGMLGQTIPDSWMAKLRGKNVIKRILNI